MFIEIDRKYIQGFVLTFFLLFPHFKPVYFESNMPYVEGIFNVCRVVSFLIVVLLILMKRRNDSFTVSKVSVWIIISELYLVIVTIINNNDIHDAIIQAVSTVAVILIYDYSSDKGNSFLSSTLLCFEVVTYINLITVFLYPEGMYTIQTLNLVHTQNYFLGYYNNFSKFFIPGLVMAFLYGYYTGKKTRAYIYYSVVMITSIKVWSGGLLAVFGIMTIVYVFFRNKTLVFNYYNYWMIHIIYYVLVIKLRIYTWLEFFIGGVLGKWASLIGRLNMADTIIKKIHEKLLLGHGLTSGADMMRITGFLHGVHAHNLLIQFLYIGGVVYVIIFSVIVILSGKPLMNNINSGASKIISVGFLGWCIHSTVEPFSSPLLMGLFIIAIRFADIYCNQECGEILTVKMAKKASL